MPTAKKAETIEQLRQKIAASSHLFFTDYAGLTVEDTTKLRSELRKDGTKYAIVKNTLFSIAAGKELAEQIEPFLKGPTAVVFTGEDPVAPAKALNDFAIESKKLKVKAAIIEGRLVDAAQIKVLASMPSKLQLQAQLLGVLQSPMRGLVTVLAGNQTGLVRVLDGIREKKEAAGA
jgi:large subunit ribosomal protein L10